MHTWCWMWKTGWDWTWRGMFSFPCMSCSPPPPRVRGAAALLSPRGGHCRLEDEGAALSWEREGM